MLSGQFPWRQNAAELLEKAGRGAARQLPRTVVSDVLVQPLNVRIAGHPADRPAESERLPELMATKGRLLLAHETDEGVGDARDRCDVVHERDRAIGRVHDDTEVRDRLGL